MIFYLIRHGESLYNAEGRIQGQSDVALSPLGLLQAQAIAEALADETIDAIFASPLRRAWQTAEPIAQHRMRGHRVHEDGGLGVAGERELLLWAFPHEAAERDAQHVVRLLEDGARRGQGLGQLAAHAHLLRPLSRKEQRDAQGGPTSGRPWRPR